MTAPRARMLALALWVLSVALGTAGVIFLALSSSARVAPEWGFRGFSAIPVLPFATVGALIAIRRPGNRIGWFFLAVGLLSALQSLTEEYPAYALVNEPGAPFFRGAAAWIQEWIWVPLVLVLGNFLFLHFPNGRLPSERWRSLVWVGIISAVVATVAISLIPGQLGDVPVDNPLGLERAGDILESIFGIAAGVLMLTIVAAAVSLILRLRRSQGEERQQLKWFTYAALLGAIVLASSTFILRPLAGTLALIAMSLVPVAAGFAILKYRLYDIDVVINKTVVFGALAAFITVVYVGVVVGIGTLIGSGDEPKLGLSIFATAIVAVAFQPVRERVQHLANRLVYGKRATPYEVLSEFSDRVAETYAADEVLPKMAKAIKDGTGAERAEVWLRSHDELRPAATWPEDVARRSQPLALTNGQLPAFAGADKGIEVRHQGELLGALIVTKPQGEPLTPAEDKLLADLASQAGLVLRNVGLTAELLQRLDELKASRQRLVAAQDEERRRLERDLHDGAQQHLIALKTRLSLAKRLAERDPAKAQDLIAKLEQEADEAIETLRDLARGIYPPLLADQGLKAALEAHARKVSFPVEVTADDISRYPQEIEAAVYFCCLEALQNVAKYANATRGVVRLSQQDGAVTFSVQDDGRGFDPATTAKGSGTQNMSDRLEALGGRLTVDSAPGRGTTVAGRLPARGLERVA